MLFDSPRRMSLHWDDEEEDAKLRPNDVPRPRTNDFPPIEFILQRTERALYLLARGVGEKLDSSSASATQEWFSTTKGFTVDRHGPSRFPGPDGTQYEWFFRITGVSGTAFTDQDELFAEAATRLRPKPRKPEPSSVPDIGDGEDLTLELLALERTRVDAVLLSRLRDANRDRLASVRRQLVALRRASSLRRTLPDASKAVAEELLNEATALEARTRDREAQLDIRERQLATKAAWLDAAYDAQKQAQDHKVSHLDMTAYDRLFPRLNIDKETAALLEVELEDASSYIRALAALEDRVSMDPASYPPALKHEKLTEVSGNSWWELRLKNSLAHDCRLIYQRVEGERMNVRIFWKKDFEKVLDRLR